VIDAFAELTLETRDVALLERFHREAFGFEVLSRDDDRVWLGPVRGPVEHPGGDRSIYVDDPAGNVVEVWDFFQREGGAREGVEALR
jgi:catechol-2,3-dioxygenase